MNAIGSSTKPIYIDSDGAAKPITGPIGSDKVPIYINSSGNFATTNIPYIVDCGEEEKTYSSEVSDSIGIIVPGKDYVMWVKYSNGLLIQSGYTSRCYRTGAATDAPVIFKYPYKNTLFSINVTPDNPFAPGDPPDYHPAADHLAVWNHTVNGFIVSTWAIHILSYQAQLRPVPYPAYDLSAPNKIFESALSATELRDSHGESKPPPSIRWSTMGFAAS